MKTETLTINELNYEDRLQSLTNLIIKTETSVINGSNYEDSDFNLKRIEL
jgi:hypothetical protein